MLINNEDLENNDIDIMLKAFVKVNNKRDYVNNVGLNITLNVQGIIISGELCNIHDYMEKIFDNKDAFIFQEEENPKYIHLKNAQIFVPGNLPLPSKEGIYWRGKLSDVNGFSIGKLVAQ